jgi:hypothetical protein
MDKLVEIRQFQLEDWMDKLVGIRQFQLEDWMDKLVGIRQFQLEDWMDKLVGIREFQLEDGSRITKNRRFIVELPDRAMNRILLLYVKVVPLV